MEQPLYKEIYNIIRQAILDEKYKPGDRIPSEKEMTERFGISRITSRKVMELLRNDGLITRHQGRGSFVTEYQEPSVESPHTGGRLTTGCLIGLVITDFSSSYGLELVSGVEKAAADRGYSLVLRRSFGIPEREQEAISDLVNLGVVGLLVFPVQAEHFSTEILKLVINQFPIVLVDRYLRGIATTSVSSDNLAGAMAATEHLLELGHTHIGIVTPPPVDTTTLEERIEGFVRKHAEKGVVFDEALWMRNVTSTLPGQLLPKNMERDIEAIKQHLLKHPEITALFAVEYNIAVLIREAAYQLGLVVPKDLSIVCFDSPREFLGEYEFTHVMQQQERMGEEAVEALLKMVNGDAGRNKILLEAIVVQGRSTAKARINGITS